MEAITDLGLGYLGAGIGAGIYPSAEQAFAGTKPIRTVEPDTDLKDQYDRAYEDWAKQLSKY